MLGLSDVKDLLSNTDERTLTLFVDVDNATRENQASLSAWQIWMKNLLDEYPREHNISMDVWESIRERIEDFLASYNPSSKALVMFVGQNYDQVFELPMKVENLAFFGKPQFGQLLWLIDEYEPYVVALVDQENAKFFVSYLGSMGFQEDLEIDIYEYDFRERSNAHPPGPGVEGQAGTNAGQGDDVFQQMLNEHRHRFYKEIVERIGKLQEQHKAERLVLAGGERAAHAIENLMSDRMKQQYVGFVNVPLFTPVPEIMEKIEPLAMEFERKQEFEIVDQVINLAKAGGRGALGRKQVEEALEMQRVELLVMVWPFEDEERDNDLAFRALQLNSGIELVHGDAGSLLHSEGQGVGARLYYAL